MEGGPGPRQGAQETVKTGLLLLTLPLASGSFPGPQLLQTPVLGRARSGRTRIQMLTLPWVDRIPADSALSAHSPYPFSHLLGPGLVLSREGEQGLMEHTPERVPTALLHTTKTLPPDLPCRHLPEAPNILLHL